MNTRFKIFLLSIPLVAIFATGVLFRSTKASSVKGCYAESLSGMLEPGMAGIFEGNSVAVPALAEASSDTQVLGQASPNEKWIEVDLSDQLLRAWDGSVLFMETRISTGLPGAPTPTGEFRVWVKLRASKMEGGQGRNYYYLPNVPFVMYFENENIPGWRGYGIHGAYWHNDFGTPRSNGCVNLPVPMAEKLYYWATPALPDGKVSVFAGPENPGIKIVIHD